MNRPPSTFPLGIFSLRSFVQEYRPRIKELLADTLEIIYPMDREWLLGFERWLICRSLEDNFLLMIVDYNRHHASFEAAANDIAPIMASVQRDLRATFMAYVGMQQMPGMVKLRYDGDDVYITNLDQ